MKQQKILIDMYIDSFLKLVDPCQPTCYKILTILYFYLHVYNNYFYNCTLL